MEISLEISLIIDDSSCEHATLEVKDLEHAVAIFDNVVVALYHQENWIDSWHLHLIQAVDSRDYRLIFPLLNV